MNRECFTTSFFINAQRTRNGMAIVQCRVSFRGLAKTFSTGVKVPIDKWNPKKQLVSGKSVVCDVSLKWTDS